MTIPPAPASTSAEQQPSEPTYAPRSYLWRGVIIVVAMQLSLALLTRVALLFQGRHEMAWNPSLLGSFGAGLWFDILAGLYASAPLWLLTLLVPGRLLRGPVGRWWVTLLLFLYSVVFLFIGIAEWFFWDEFSVRFNFIAVDYLVYTQEVIDNIQQSYPMPAILGGLALAGLLITSLVVRLGAPAWICKGDTRWLPRLGHTLGGAALLIGISYVCSQSQLPRFRNEFNRELGKNGIYAFCASFWESEIDYERFYMKRDTEVAMTRAKSLLTLQDTPPLNDDPQDLRRVIHHDGPEHPWNVVLVSVESLSAEFMSHFQESGFKLRSWLTPNLDRIADEGILFTNLYATGTRTVRGLEALTLCVPPTPGQSIVWRPNNDKLATTASLFRARGYDTSYIYGGDAMFDNMNTFFAGNGYRVIDRMAKSKKDITFQNAWGVCDEDLFHWATKEADANHAAGKPFFMHVMTVSNHRPFTFPEGRIDMTYKQGRPAAVKYTDYAIGDFLKQAQTKPWFKNTVFVVVADHCHGSAGKVELDVTKYHIPCIIWNPELIKPHVITDLCSQVDVMPTLFGLLNWSYTTSFYGQDVLSAGYGKEQQRAFVSNYQKIAVITDKTLALLKPKQEITLGTLKLKTGAVSRDSADPSLASGLAERLEDTIAYYQSASWRFRNGKMKEQPQPGGAAHEGGSEGGSGTPAHAPAKVAAAQKKAG
ncbi:LTA synthase family protein [Roseimicrobium sp. ORNL1]|uniref:LTA synthase family protein n=1 Tax=Roseimicrobium sp. ORNL1 TaxID=2711231 RepID=UPI0013E1422B|nr:LTA synthase family protein [Roseimicrobium sp. ORNL1]QIE99982.1 sulfatase-like hydrolase/transferase [Roseimicrobium sp. ORNL1]